MCVRLLNFRSFLSILFNYVFSCISSFSMSESENVSEIFAILFINEAADVVLSSWIWNAVATSFELKHLINTRDSPTSGT
jgi:hypothetical protein